jgi:ATP-dependent helicase/nuclease subunit B
MVRLWRANPWNGNTFSYKVESIFMFRKNGIPLDISNNDIIITVNRRLSSHLKRQFEQQQFAQRKAWSSPEILPLSQWLEKLWANHYPDGVLLDNLGCALAWQKIVGEDSLNYPLLDMKRAAKQAEEAWRLLQEWLVPLDSMSHTDSEDVAAFLRWAQRYQQHCAANAWSDTARLGAELQLTLATSSYPYPARLFLLGFDSFPPAIKKFIDTLASRCEVIIPDYTGTTKNTQRIMLNDRESEIRVMAQWAKKQWQNNPQYSIACIVPDLLATFLTIERIFTEEFGDDLMTTVNIAGGKSLLSYQVIEIALSLLQLVNNQTLTQPQLTALLLSPYLVGGTSEWQQRAIIDQRLRQYHVDSFTLTTLLGHENLLQTSPRLKKLLINAEPLCSKEQIARYPSQWANYFAQVLSHFGWPGERSLNSTEFQVVNHFQQELGHYAGLDWLLSKQSFQEAWHTFRQILSDTLFQTESNQNAPIQVLGLLEASGLYFDQMWLSSMNDDTWPPSPSPNPFIPTSLQRELSMPRSCGAHELEFAQHIMQRLAHSTPSLIASYSQQKQDENTELALSPLIQKFKATTLEALDLVAPAVPNAQPQTFEWQDNLAPPVQSDENIRGGATILKRQAQCPFWSFAEIRLRARPFDEVELGLSATERGNLMHAVLAEVWRRLGNSEVLHQHNEVELLTLVKKSVQDVLDDELNPMTKNTRKTTLSNASVEPGNDDKNKVTDSAHTTDQMYVDDNINLPNINTQIRLLEEQRLQQLVLQWLAVEKKRSPFVVSGIEQPCDLTLGQLTLHLQVDRIDTLNDGSHIIIDYKTGMPSSTSWFGERPDEPQLPLYALADTQHVRGLAFAQIRAQSLKFNGITAEAGVLPGVKPSATPWPTLIEEWQSTLSALSEDFYQGRAAVSPKSYPTTCAYCHLSSVCRIYEQDSGSL